MMIDVWVPCFALSTHGQISRRDFETLFSNFPRKYDLTFQIYYLLRRQFLFNVKSYLLGKIRKNITDLSSAEFFQRVVKVYIVWLSNTTLTLRALITNAADDILIFLYVSEKIRLAISCESSDRQSIHIKCQVLSL